MSEDNQSPIVVNFSEYKNKDSIAVLEEALAKFKSGEYNGMLFAFRRNGKNHGVGATGEYRRHPEDIRNITEQLFCYFQGRNGVVIED